MFRGSQLGNTASPALVAASAKSFLSRIRLHARDRRLIDAEIPLEQGGVQRIQPGGLVRCRQENLAGIGRTNREQPLEKPAGFRSQAAPNRSAVTRRDHAAAPRDARLEMTRTSIPICSEMADSRNRAAGRS